MITLSKKFTPNNVWTKEFIETDILRKLSQKLQVVSDATEDELIDAVSSFFAYGKSLFTVDFIDNELLHHISQVLVGFGYLRPDDKNKNVFKVALSFDRLAFKTKNVNRDSLRVDTLYGTRYTDGSHDEVDQSAYKYVEGYPAEKWFAHQAAQAA